MHDQEPQFLQLGEGTRRRRIAFRQGPGGREIGLLWLSGFMSDMASTKATALAAWAELKTASHASLRLFRSRAFRRIAGGSQHRRLARRIDRSRAVAQSRQTHRHRLLDGRLARAPARAAFGAETVQLRLPVCVLIAPAHDMTETLDLGSPVRSRRGRRSSVTASTTNPPPMPSPIRSRVISSRKDARIFSKATVSIRFVRFAFCKACAIRTFRGPTRCRSWTC